jgi:mono/diheme cytochrome c family protein
MLYRYGLATIVVAIAAALLPSAPPLLAPAAIAAAQRSVPPIRSRTQPVPGAVEGLDRGKAVYDEWCGACHDPGPRHPGTQALEALYKGKKPAALEERTDLLPKLTETFVRKGVSVMPPFRKTEISDADLAALAAYLARPR